MENKKIIIGIAIVIGVLIIALGAWLLFFNKDNKDSKSDNKKEEDKIAKVENGKMDPIKLEGFTITLEQENENGRIAIENTSVKKDTAYILHFVIAQKEENDTTTDVNIPANAKEKLSIPTNININNIKSIKYSAEKTKTVLKGSPDKKTEK